jgi:4-diphosphocytidyl-2-C-methyl-D-erythritol kinase
MRARGVGDILTAEEIEPLDLVIAKPEKGVSTKDAYKLYDEMKIKSEGDNIALLTSVKNKDELCKYLVNDLTLPALKMNTGIKPLLKIMKDNNKGCALMSGSGSAVFGVCENREDAERLFEAVPDSYYKIITKTCKECLTQIE